MPIIDELEKQIHSNSGKPFHISFNYEDIEYIGLEFSEELSKVLRILNDQKNSGSIEIVISDSLKQIDHTSLSILLLICKQIPSIIVNFRITSLPDRQKNDNSINRIKAYLYNFILFSSFSAGKLNFFVNGEDLYKKEIIPINWKYPSSTVLPVIYIDKSDTRTIELLSNKDLFWKTKSDLFDFEIENIFKDFENGIKLAPSESNEKAYSHLCRNYIQRQNYSIYHFIILMYAKCLKELRSFYLIENKREYFINKSEHKSTFAKSQTEPFRGINNSANYFKIIIETDNQLKEKSPLFILIFSFLLNEYLEELDENDRKNNFPIKLEKKINEILSLTEGIVLGLFEVVRNVIEHSTSGKGVISFRVYKQEDLEKLKGKEIPEIKEFINSNIQKNGETKFIDINLYDISSLGIIDTYQNKNKFNGEQTLSTFFSNTRNTPEVAKRKFENNYGLLFFAGQVLTNDGFFRVTTINKNEGVQYISNNNIEKKADLVNGTSYSIIFPLKKSVKSNLNNNVPILREDSSLVGESEFIRYDFVDFDDFIAGLNNSEEKSQLIINIDLGKELYRNNDLLRVNLFPKIKRAASSLFTFNKETVFLFNTLNNASYFNENPGNLQRLIDELQEIESICNIVLLIENESFLRAIIDAGINRAFKKPLLVYFKEHDYFKTFLINSDGKDDLLLYNYVYNNIPEQYKKYLNELPETRTQNLRKITVNSILLYGESSKIKEFDSIIQHRGRSLYSYYLEKCLNTDISDTHLFNKSNKNFQGYRISNGHFRLGSKVHIKDFFYAKRLFQVSNVVNHLAFEIVYYIRNNRELFKEISEKGVNIIGYAKYSELLLYRIQQLLKIIILNKEIEYNTYKDYESESLLHETKNENLPFLVIVPISSTYSTSSKIKTGLENIFGNKINIFDVYLNIINVADRSYLDFLEGKRKFESCNILVDNYWQEPNKNDIGNNIVPINNSEVILKQKYFIQLFTEWHNISNCALCFGNNEPPLIETDKASVTPLLIFGDPIEFPEIDYNDNRRECTNFHQYHYYGHYRIERKDNIHFIDPIDFLKYNKKNILDWFSSIRSELQSRINNVRVSIISPDGKYNSTFVHLVNKYLFNNIANVILFNAESDYISNFKEFYGDILDNSECIVYVDDQISTGNTLLSITQYLSNCDNKKFSFLITLISRLNNSDIEKINSNSNVFKHDEKRSNNIYAYQQYNIPTVISSHLECPICLQRRHYNELSVSASLDVTEYYIYKKIERLNHKRNIASKNDSKFRGYDLRINEWIIPTKDTQISSFVYNPFKHDTSLKFCIEEYFSSNLSHLIGKSNFRSADFRIIIKGIIKHIKFRLGNNNYSFNEISLCIIKVVSQPPFINYYSIRKNVFHLLETGLVREFSKLQKRPINDQLFRILKLYFKRLSGLKSNFLIKRQNYIYLLKLFTKLQERSLKETGIKDLLELRSKHIILINSYLKAKGLVSLNNQNELINVVSLDVTYEPALKFAVFDVIVGKYFTLFKANWNLAKEAEISITEVIYSSRALKNIENTLKNRSDFHYYIATLIKEISKDNEIKSIYLEKNITEWFEEIKKSDPPHILRLLIRTIKLENTGIIKKYGDLVLQNILLKADFKEQVESQRNEISNLAQNNKLFEKGEKDKFYQSVIDKLFTQSGGFISKILPLLEFLTIEEESSCSSDSEFDKKNAKVNISISNKNYYISESFFHFMMLSWFLEIDGKKGIDTGMKSLDEKMKFINDRILDILRIKANSIDSDIYCFVFHKQLDSLSSVSNDNCSLYSNKDSNIEDWDLGNCLIQYVTKGMRQRDGGGPQNILEFKKENNNWRSLKKYFKSIDEKGQYEFVDEYENGKFKSGFLDNYFEGNIKFKNKSHLLFYRITQMEYFEKKDDITQNTISEISIKPQAIILIASNKPNYLKAEKIRYLLLLKKHLSEFFHHHYENDSYNTALQQLKENSFYKDLSHGADTYAITAFKKHYNLYSYLEGERNYYKNILWKLNIKVLPYKSNVIDTIYDEPDIEKLKEEFNLFFNLSLNQFRIASVLVRFQNDPTKMEEYLSTQKIYKKSVEEKELESLIRRLGSIVGRTPGIGDDLGEDYFIHDIKFDEGFKLYCHIELLEIIFSEILVNIKKANNKEVLSVNVIWRFKKEGIISQRIEIVNGFISKQRISGFGLKMVSKILHGLYLGSVTGSEFEPGLYKTTLKFSTYE